MEQDLSGSWTFTIKLPKNHRSEHNGPQSKLLSWIFPKAWIHLGREGKTALSTVQVSMVPTKLPCSNKTILKQQMKLIQQTPTVSHSCSILTSAFALWTPATHPIAGLALKMQRGYKSTSSKGWDCGQLRKHNSEMGSQLTLHSGTGCLHKGVISCNTLASATQWKHLAAVCFWEKVDAKGKAWAFLHRFVL